MSSIVTKTFRVVFDVSMDVDESQATGLVRERIKDGLRDAVLKLPTVRDLDFDRIVEVSP